jgi:type I restriction enzyme S subunit
MSNGSLQHLGKVAYTDRDYDYAFGGFMGLIIPSKSVSARFVFHTLLSPAFLHTILKEGRGANINNLKFSDIEKFPVPLPPLALQQTFAAQIEAIEQQKERIRRSLDETRTLLAARMQYYFE